MGRSLRCEALFLRSIKVGGPMSGGDCMPPKFDDNYDKLCVIITHS